MSLILLWSKTHCHISIIQKLSTMFWILKKKIQLKSKHQILNGKIFDMSRIWLTAYCIPLAEILSYLGSHMTALKKRIMNLPCLWHSTYSKYSNDAVTSKKIFHVLGETERHFIMFIVRDHSEANAFAEYINSL